MTSSFVCATLNLGRKKSLGTEPKSATLKNDELCLNVLHIHGIWIKLTHDKPCIKLILVWCVIILFFFLKLDLYDKNNLQIN